MDQVPLATSSTIVSLEDFWSSVFLYYGRPNLVNRKLAAVAQLIFCEISLHSSSIRRVSEIFTREALLYEIRKLGDHTTITSEFIKSIAEIYDKDVVITERSWDCFTENPEGTFVSIRTLFARNKNEKCIEVVIFDKKNTTATFFAVLEPAQIKFVPPFPYHLQLTLNGNLRIIVNSFDDADTNTADWLADKLFPKLLKWAENRDEATIKSLSLIAADEYCTLYMELKSKYAENLVGSWPQNTKTDPKKYVYEDLAIAAYLICLWHRIGAEDVNFVDCGCGNGLLVYILSREGYRGCGLDVRSRKIWDIFEGEADLRIETVTPQSVFPNATWIIGNHSDELTPWIPVIALKSSPKTNYFVIPCCSYDFSGQKYVRINTRWSQYHDYLNYITDISDKCGFKTSVDKLRIPSTKRTCLVGVRENYDLGTINIQIDNFIDSRLNSRFIARNSVEEVRNCTKLNKNLIQRIIHLVVNKLLATQNLIKKESNGEPWNKGGTITLRDLSTQIPTDDLKLLKNEFGGLQTLLKNHRYIFKVRMGAVSLQDPLTVLETTKYRDKPCWFNRNHPNGCPFTDQTCAYKH